ncbi:uncharacterized protein LOC131029727 [Cryptomeria japonica]|uniref:uncharacterized protein LOC131029727 n=1 Tax=Cryptomeria japonica TaxID=3369 RepID=UPI0027DA540E|nr:uncharacterized protein LOC131029727 [Cryptomeria japonica]
MGKTQIELLTPYNYETWKKSVWNFLREKGCTSYVKESIPAPIDANALQAWEINRERALGYICSLVSFDLQFHLESCKTRKEAWETIENLVSMGTAYVQPTFDAFLDLLIQEEAKLIQMGIIKTSKSQALIANEPKASSVDTFEDIQYGQVILGIVLIEVQETCVDTSSPTLSVVSDDTGTATSMAPIVSVQQDIHCLPDTVTWNDYLTDIAGLFCESYLADLEDTIECIHLLFDEVSSSSSDVEGEPFNPLVLYPHDHSSQLDMTVATIEQHLEETPLSSEEIPLSLDFFLHPSQLGSGLSSFVVWARTLDLNVTTFGIDMETNEQPRTTTLYYEVNVIPRFNFPAIFVERVIRKDLPLNLQSVAARAEAKSKALSKEVKSLCHEIDHTLESAEVQENQSISTLENLCRISINDLANAWNNWVTSGQTCSLDRPCVVDEVHLRRLDDLLENGGVHRRVIATITIKAPSQSVWKVLTAYESLPEFVPNLAISKIISRENNKVCLLQEGCKGLLYMVLHARIVLDLWEHPEHEILFEQVEGDFDSFRGNWILEQLGSQHTLLKYVVETKMQKNCLLAEAIVEEVIYKDLPSNLCALRDHVENKETADLNFPARVPYTKSPKAQNIHVDTEDLNLKKRQGTIKGLKVSEDKPTEHRSKVPGLQTNMDILKEELYKFISDHGQEGFMPLRKHLRLHGRADLEKAITRMGGFRIIASLMNLSLSYKDRKPKGYWDSLENLKQEVSHFQRTWGMDPTYMPSRKSFERAGRYDLARAFEKWGGVHEISRLLKLKLRRPRESMSPLGQEEEDEDDEDDDLFRSNMQCQSMLGIHPNNNNNSSSSSSSSSSNGNSKKWLAALDESNPNWAG